MRVRAKFTCVGITKRRGWGGKPGDPPFVYDAEFQAVTAGGGGMTMPRSREEAEENEIFYAATPCGDIKLSTLASDSFQVGVDYYIDFTPVE